MSKLKPKRKKSDGITLPSSVSICGKTFNVTRNKKGPGGTFNGWSQKIEWNAEHQDGASDTLLHEISETIICERRHRYHRSANNEQGDLLIVMTHNDFEQFIHDLYGTIKPYLDFSKEKVLK